MALRATTLAVLAAVAAAHGSLTIPLPRNNFGRIDPANRSVANPIPSGPASRLPASHINMGPCAGGACLWFSEGCFNGCDNCTATLPAHGNQVDKPPAGCKTIEPTLPEAYRTYNIKNLSANGDWTRYHPWRAPGHSPVLDPCGIAGGYTHYTGGGGETPPGAKQGAPGSQLAAGPSAATWKKGQPTEVGWMVDANHGGGYLFSVCPSSSAITEDCFQANTLEYVGTTHTIRYLDARPELEIPARDVNVGTKPSGSAWRLNPIPACNCDMGRGCSLTTKDNKSKAYTNETAHTSLGCPTGLQFGDKAPFPYGDSQQIWDRNDPERGIDDWVIVDQVRAPATAGTYVLRWRWDTEQNPQVWTNCADITVL